MKNVHKIMLIALLLFFVSYLISCAAKQIPAPSSKSDTLVVVPRLFINMDPNVSMKNDLLICKLIILLESVDTGKEKSIVIYSLTDDYMMIENIAPGKYLIKTLKIGVDHWRAPLHEYERELTQYLEVLPGHMTIFPYKFLLYTYNNGGYIDFLEINKKERGKILAFLSKHGNYQLWQKKD